MAGSSAQKRMLERISHRLVEPYQGRRGMCFSLAVLLLCSLIGYGFFRLDLAESNIITVYMLGVLLVAMLTAQWRCWVISSVLAVLLFNCLYAEPRFTLFYYDPQHTVAMLLLLLASLSVGWLSSLYRSRMAEQAALNLRAESERLRVDLLRSVGHDLRTPLTGISGEAQLLLNKGDEMPAEKRHALYASIYDDAEWLIAMVENMLFVTRINGGSVNVDRQPELLADLVEEAMRHISKKSAAHDIRLDLDAGDMLLVHVDAHMIMQVVINLVNNAVKHTPAGSTIRVTLRQQGGEALLEVADDGPGLGDNSSRAFDAFFSTDGANRGERRGMGLGLPLSRSIITLHGGSLYYRDNKPQGAVFGFTLPTERMETQHDNDTGN